MSDLVGHAWPAGLRERASGVALPAAVVGLSFAAAAGAWLVGQPAIVVLVLAALPIGFVVGYRYTLPMLVVVLAARTFLDASGDSMITGGLAVALVALALLTLPRTAGWTLPVLAGAVYLFISAWAGDAVNGGRYTYPEALRLLSGVAVVVVAANAPGKLTVARVQHVVQAIGVVPAVLALVQLATGTASLNHGVARASGTLAHENSAAMLFALCNIVTFAHVLEHRRHRPLHVALLGLFLLAQLSTGSIGGFVAVLVMVVLFLGSRAVRRADRLMIGLLGLGLGLWGAMNSTIGQERLNEYFGGTGQETSLEWRFAAWDAVMAAWRANPWWGNGVGWAESSTVLGGNVPHNEYVRMLAEIGIAGLALVVALGLWYAMTMRRLAKTSPNPTAASLALALLGGVAVNAIAANTLHYSASFYLELFILAACWRIARAPAPSAAPLAPGEAIHPIPHPLGREPGEAVDYHESRTQGGSTGRAARASATR